MTLLIKLIAVITLQRYKFIPVTLNIESPSSAPVACNRSSSHLYIHMHKECNGVYSVNHIGREKKRDFNYSHLTGNLTLINIHLVSILQHSCTKIMLHYTSVHVGRTPTWLKLNSNTCQILQDHTLSSNDRLQVIHRKNKISSLSVLVRVRVLLKRIAVAD